MFIRFVSGEIDERSHRAAGLFCAVTQLEETCYIPKYELETLDEIVRWFERHLASPFDYLPEHTNYDPAVCWFKSTANECLAKAWELVTVLERNDILIWTIKSYRTGCVFYEDEFQVFALPHRDARRRR
jgi:hypothetical protein